MATTTRKPQTKGQLLRTFDDLYTRVGGSGLIAPQCIPVEESVLGAMLTNKVAAQNAIGVLGPRNEVNSPFYRESHFEIYRAMFDLDSKGEPIDVLSVTNRLRQNGALEDVGGPSYIVELSSNIVSTANVETHCRLILERYLDRSLIRICEDIKLRSFLGADDTFDRMDGLMGELFELDQMRLGKRGQSVATITDEVLTHTIQVHSAGKPVTGVPSSLVDLDEIIGGWQKTDLIIVAARPSMGKTALALTFARGAALNPVVESRVPVGIFSLEMGAEQLVLRLVCAEGGVDSQKTKKGRMNEQEWRQFTQACNAVKGAPIFIDDTAGLTPAELRSRARWLYQTHHIGLLVIDYLQLMEVGEKRRETRDLDIGVITRTAKAIAKELNIPVIMLSQLNRGVESRNDKRPMLSDLRESGNIENDADIVLFIYRPEYYDIDQFYDGKPTGGMAELIIGKHRNGPVGEVRTEFDGPTGRFLNSMPSFEPRDPGTQSFD